MQKILKILRWTGVVVFIIFAGYIGIIMGKNVGGIINRLLGKNKPTKKAVIDSEGNTIGKSVVIKTDANPFRDTSILKTHDGDEIELPKGVRDSNVSRLIKVGEHDYKVVLKHEKVTDIFNSM